VKQALLEPADKELKRPKRGSVIDPYEVLMV
jgi:hypothetical protein